MEGLVLAQARLSSVGSGYRSDIDLVAGSSRGRSTAPDSPMDCFCWADATNTHQTAVPGVGSGLPAAGAGNAPIGLRMQEARDEPISSNNHKAIIEQRLKRIRYEKGVRGDNRGEDREHAGFILRRRRPPGSYKFTLRDESGDQERPDVICRHCGQIHIDRFSEATCLGLRSRVEPKLSTASAIPICVQCGLRAGSDECLCELERELRSIGDQLSRRTTSS